MTEANIAYEATEAGMALPIGTKLAGDQFTITDYLGAGGFGITYRAKDNVLGRTIVIKECFPGDFCVRQGKNVLARSQGYVKPVRSIVNMFMREARSLAKLRHPNIVGVHRAFEENQTAYMALDLIEGRDLFDILDTGTPKLSPARVRDILLQLLDAIEKVHDLGLLHRDISPDNILIEKTGTPILIDFGAARGDPSRHTRAVSSLLVVKDGYSPQEFYVAGSEQTPCSDLYALAATFYHVLSGKAPTSSQSRLVEIAGHKPDPSVPLLGHVEGYDDAFLKAIDMAMNIHPDDRIQSAAKWRSMITEGAANSAASPRSEPILTKKDVSLEFETALTQLVAETNDEVRRTSKVPVEPEEKAPVRAEEPSKPAWIDEFNQETLAPEDAEAWVDDAFEDRSLSQATGARERSDTNWIDLAQEKQEQKLRQQAAYYGLEDDRVASRIASTVSRNPFDETDAIEVAPQPRKRSFVETVRRLGLYLVLVLFVAFMILIR